MNLDLTGYRLEKESRIDGEFEGFNSDQIFMLQDGTYWHQTQYKYLYRYAYCPIVRIYSNYLRKVLIVEGVDDYVEVAQVSGFKSKIVNDFRGWSGNTIFELQNGQIWKQDEYKYKYMYAYRPDATFINIGYRTFMTVKGHSIRVKKIK